MASSFKNLPSHQLDTTHSKRRGGKMLVEQSKGLVSAFDASDGLQHIHSEIVERKTSETDLESIMEINDSYLRLFCRAIGRSIQPEELLMSKNLSSKDKKNGSGAGAKAQRQERYQTQCKKLFQSNKAAIQKLQQLNKIKKHWKEIQNFIQNQPIKQIQNRGNSMEEVESLVERFVTASHTLEELEEENKEVLGKRVQDLENMQGDPLTTLNKTEKQFKKTQRKVNKEMGKFDYYQQKCTDYQQKLQAIQKKIERAIITKGEIQMKLSQQESKKGRFSNKSALKSRPISSNQKNRKEGDDGKRPTPHNK